MKVTYLLRYYPTLTETFVYNEVTQIQSQDPGIQITLAALGTRSDGAAQDILPTVPVLHVPRRPLVGRMRAPTTGMRWLQQHQRPKDVARLPWLAHRLRDTARIHVHFAGEAAEWAHALWLDHGIPYTVMVHAVDLFRPRPSFQEVLGAAESVLTIAEHHVRLLHARTGIQAHLVRCGPPMATLQTDPLPGTGPLRALFVGRNVPKKGLPVLLRAWENAPKDAHLDVISTVEGRCPPRTTVHGPQPASAVYAAIRRANVLVLPCQPAPSGDLDGVPVALMEALAAGRPVITTPVSGIPELVDEAVGWLVPPGDDAALSAALHAAADPQQRTRRGAAGPDRLRARGFTLQAQAEGVRRCWGR